MRHEDFRVLWLKILSLTKRVSIIESTGGGGGGGGISALTGDVTASGTGSVAATIASDAVTNAKAANMAQSTIKGRAAAAGTGDPTDLTPNETSTVLDGATDPFLRTSAAGSSGINQLTGDVTAGPGTGSVAATIANDAVTDAKLRNSAAVSVIGRSANSSGDPADIAAGANNKFLTRRSNALSFETIDLASADVTGLLPLANLAARTADIEFTIDGTGSVIQTGIAGDLGPIDVACTIVSVTMLADQSGSIVVDIWKDSFADFPPDVSDSITASAKPTISGATNSQDTTLTGWSTGKNISAGDTLRYNVDSVTSIKRVVITLKVSIP